MPRKRPVNVGELVLKELCQRMDPATRLVTPNWRAIASKLGVSHVTLAKHIKRLKADGIVSTVIVEQSAPSAPSTPRRTATAHPDPTWLPNASKRYLISESVDAARAASAVPQFTRPPKPPKERKARYKTTKAAMDAAADERMAERSRFIMDDFLRRLDPATRIVVANARDIVGRSNGLLSLTSFGRVVRAFKEAGLISPSPSQTSSDFHLGNKRYIVAASAANRDWLAFAREYRLKTAHPSGERNKSETTRSILGEKILDFLRSRTASETGLAMASRVELSKELGYSPPVISSALAALVASGRLERITGKPRRGLGRASNAYRIPAQTLNPETLAPDPENYGIIYAEKGKPMDAAEYTFSKNLFWDADPADLDLQRNMRYIVQRVLERGSIDDLKSMFHIYGEQSVVSAAKELRSLEPKALSFIACVANEPKENFRCCAQKQSSQAPWIY